MMSRSATTVYNTIYSAEVNDIYVETLRRNHAAITAREFNQNIGDPSGIHCIDLRTRDALDLLRTQIEKHGDVDILIGGPPCQGFSTANRNSGSIDNPHNAHVATFVRYVEVARPRFFVMENVQGIIWAQRATSGGNGRSLVGQFARRLKKLGYLCFPKLLDAVWYGVPQQRTRFFLVGIREDLGYSESDFGTWGPFPSPTHGPGTPHPYVSVRDAIADLPLVENGCCESRHRYKAARASEDSFVTEMRRGADAGYVTEHITSKHSEYVLERFRRIPEGGNWESIAKLLTNYSNAARTHSNIYKRLVWDEPSITIGHYRKSMLVHPQQHRGLSLREASRLQSFPDWFQFVGSLDPRYSGLTSKQQQLANAVAPLLSRAIAEFLSGI